ncbi:MAG: cell division protein FtsZ [Candidatus Staskawiczbacteria bacterium]|nr:cell division protein FtsZ [Candidatus Staskawiczbacteria bacterium]
MAKIKKKKIKLKVKKVKKKIIRKIKKNKPAKRRKILLRKKIVKKETAGFAAESLFKAKIKVIGIGGGGGSIVSEIGRSLEKATFVVADTDIRALKKKSGIKYFWFGEELTHGLGTGVNVELAKQAAESAKEKISGIFKDQDIIIFIASLGGGLGSGATQVFAEAAREFGGITFGIFTTPFRFEGKNKQRIAQNALKALRKSLNVSLVIPNEKIFKIIDETTPITNAFSTVNKSLIESLESLIDLIYNPGIINIDFADLRTILSGRGNSAFLNTVEESGKDRIEKICENILKNPLLQSNGFKADKILFNIAGSENLSMFEVEKISSHIATLNPKAKIIFGISKNAKLKSKIKTTILMTGAPIGTQVKEEVKKELPVAKKADPVKETPGKKEEPKKKKVALRKKPAPSIPAKKEPASQGNKSPVSFVPVFEVPTADETAILPILEQKNPEISQVVGVSANKNSATSRHGTIRRSGLEIKKAEELQEKKKIDQEKEWEIPAFLRKVKFKS